MNNLAVFEVVYNEREDLLFIHSEKSKTKESIEVIDGVVIDIDRDNNLAGLEIFDASEFFAKMDSKINLNVLKNLNEIKIGLQKYRNYAFITLGFKVDGMIVSEKMPPFSLKEYESPLVASVST